MLKWMCQRVDGKIGAKETPIGLMPKEGDLDLSGLDISSGNMKALMNVDLKEWKAEVPDIEALCAVREPTAGAFEKAA